MGRTKTQAKGIASECMDAQQPHARMGWALGKSAPECKKGMGLCTKPASTGSTSVPVLHCGCEWMCSTSSPRALRCKAS